MPINITTCRNVYIAAAAWTFFLLLSFTLLSLNRQNSQIGDRGVPARQNTIVRGIHHRAITRLPCDYRALPLQFYVSTSVAWASRHRGTRLPAKSGYRLCRIVFICRNRARTESRSPACTQRCVVGELQVARLAREI